MTQRLKRRIKRLPRLGGKRGPPGAYSPEVVRAILAAYSAGVGLRDAAHAAGISYSTAKAWAKESRENPNGPKGEFWPLLRDSLATAVAIAANEIRRTDQKWWLSRMRPKRFGEKTTKHEISGPQGGSIHLTAIPSAAVEAELNSLEAELAELKQLKPK